MSPLLVVVFALLASAANCLPAPGNHFYPFGEGTVDRKLSRDSSEPVALTFRDSVTFLGVERPNLYIFKNGYVSLSSKTGGSKIAPFHANLEMSDTGNVWYRLTGSLADAQRIVKDVRRDFPGPDVDTFGPTSFVVVTWENMVVQDETNEFTGLVTFQLIVVADTTHSFAYFLYDTNNNYPTPSRVESLVKAGFTSGDDDNQWEFELVYTEGSRKAAALFEAMGNSNIGQNGIWAYQIDGRTDGNVIPAVHEVVEVEQPQGDSPPLSDTELQDGANTLDVEVLAFEDQCSLTCSPNARCDTYPTGSCCSCNPGYIGNGLHCLSTSENSRMNGRVNGTVNGVRIPDDVHLHTFIMAPGGRTFTAISPMPEEVAYSLQLLLPVGEMMGWLFAQTAKKGINGFMQTGANMKYVGNIAFESGEEVTVTQKYSGVNEDGHIQGYTNIDGNVPFLPAGTGVTVPLHSEVYTKYRPGYVYSSEQRSLTAGGNEVRFSVEQTITFEECEADDINTDGSLTAMRMNTTNAYSIYEESGEILRYAMITNIGPDAGTPSDPCVNNNCDVNARCLAVGTSFICECNPGFEGDGYRCTEAPRNPCESNDCDVNAICYPSGSRYVCQCSSGYIGDGRTCTPDQPRNPCEANVCDASATCYPSGSSYVCQCNSGYTGDGRTCTPVEQVNPCQSNDCDPNADCYPSSQTTYVCRCQAGFTGDGRSCTRVEQVNPCQSNDCDPNADCYPSSQTTYVCRCQAGFTGDGRSCTREGVTVDPCQVGDCDVNADCYPIYEPFPTHTCRCRAGYSGDGRTCTRVDPCTSNRCDVNAVCRPMENGYTCTCNPGYQGDGYNCDLPEQLVPLCSDCDSNSDCYPEGRGFRCVCEAGYEGNGVTCRDIDECVEGREIACDVNAQCYNTRGSYTCYCQPGYRGDGQTCEAIPQADGSLLFGRGMSVMKMYLDDGQQGGKIYMRTRQTVVGVGYDCVDDMAYWTDISRKVIMRATLDGRDVSTIIRTGLDSPEGIAIDHLSRNIYWTDSGYDRIEVANLDGGNRRVLFDSDLYNPRAIVVDPVGGYMYWADWNRPAPKIEKAYMDGSNREVIVESNLIMPNGLTIDLVSQLLCWADAGTNKVECMNLNGDPRSRYTVFNNAQYPFSLASLGQNLYWTDWQTTNVQSVNKNGAQVSESIALPQGGNGRVYGLAAITSCPAGNNGCGSQNGGCSSLCLPTPGGQVTCTCPTSPEGNEIPCN